MNYYDIVYYDTKDSYWHSFLFSTLVQPEYDQPMFIRQAQYPETWHYVYACPIVGKRLEYMKGTGKIKDA